MNCHYCQSPLIIDPELYETYYCNNCHTIHCYSLNSSALHNMTLRLTIHYFSYNNNEYSIHSRFSMNVANIYYFPNKNHNEGNFIVDLPIDYLTPLNVKNKFPTILTFL